MSSLPMNRLVAAVAVVCLAASVNDLRAADETVAVAAYDLSFAMPGKPKDDGAGNYTFTTDNSNTIYKVALATAGASMEPTASTNLDSLRDLEVKNLNGKLISEKAFTLGGHKGREFSIIVPGEVEILAHFYAVVADKRLIELIVIRSPDSEVSPAAVKRFFSSLKLGLGVTPQ